MATFDLPFTKQISFGENRNWFGVFGRACHHWPHGTLIALLYYKFRQNGLLFCLRVLVGAHFSLFLLHSIFLLHFRHQTISHTIVRFKEWKPINKRDVCLPANRYAKEMLHEVKDWTKQQHRWWWWLLYHTLALSPSHSCVIIRSHRTLATPMCDLIQYESWAIGVFLIVIVVAVVCRRRCRCCCRWLFFLPLLTIVAFVLMVESQCSSSSSVFCINSHSTPTTAA